MSNIDKLAELLEKEFEANGIDKEAGFLGRIGAGIVRGGQAMGRGLAAAGGALKGTGPGLGAKIRGGYQSSMAAAAVKPEMAAMAKQRGAGIQPSMATPSAPRTAPTASTGVSSSLERLRSMRSARPSAPSPIAAPASRAVPMASVSPLAQRMGTAAPAAAAPAKKGWAGGAASLAGAGASMLLPGNKKENMSSGAYGTPIHLAETEMKELIEKIAAEMPDSTPEERAAVLASLSVDLGFSDLINAKVASILPVKQEKTAAVVSKKIAGRDVDFEKMTWDDVVARLSSRFGNSVNAAQIAAEEKTASVKKTASQRLLEKVQAELARPT